MAAHSITQLLNAYHSKLNQHTEQIKTIQTDVNVLKSSVAELEEQLAKEDESSGLRAGLRDWLVSIKELL